MRRNLLLLAAILAMILAATEALAARDAVKTGTTVTFSLSTAFKVKNQGAVFSGSNAIEKLDDVTVETAGTNFTLTQFKVEKPRASQSTMASFTGVGSTYVLTDGGATWTNLDEYKVEVKASDSVLERDLTWNFAYDHAKPAIAILSGGQPVTPGRYTNLASLTVTITDGFNVPTFSAKLTSQATGQVTTVTLTKGSGNNYSLANPGGLNLSDYMGELSVSATDEFGNTDTATASLLNDNTNPTVQMLRGGSDFTAGPSPSLAELTIRLADSFDTAPTLVSVVAHDKGGANANLSTTQAGNDYVIQAPADAPFATPGELTIDVTARDMAGNTFSKTFLVDNLGPTVAVKNKGAVFTAGVVLSISDMTVQLGEWQSDTPTIVSVTMTNVVSGATSALSTSAQGGNLYALSGPALDATGTVANVEIKAKDKYNNLTTYTVRIQNDGIAPTITILKGGAEFAEGQAADFGVFTIRLEDNTDTNPTLVNLRAMNIASNAYVDLVTVKNGNDYTIQAPADPQWASLTELYLTATAKDTYSNISSKQVIIDNVGPALKVTKSGQDFSAGGEVRGWNQLAFQIEDVVDTTPSLLTMTITGGPASVNIPLGWNRAGKTIQADYPNLLPGGPADAPYVLTMTAKDRNNNPTSKTVTFNYVFDQAFYGNALRLPAVQHAFLRKDGNKPALVSSKLSKTDGSTMSGAADIYAQLSANATVALVLNGVTVQPGQTQKVATGYDFTAKSGVIELSAMPAVAGQAGAGGLMLRVDDPKVPLVTTKVTIWKTTTALTSSKWTVEKMMDQFVATVQETGTPAGCSLTTSLAQAAATDVFASTKPPCVVEFGALPDDLKQDTSTTPKISGRAASEGTKTISYTVYLVDRDGTKVKFDEGTHDMTVGPIQTLAYDFDPKPASALSLVEPLNLVFRQTAGTTCAPVLDEATAKASLTSSVPSCLVEMTTLPNGLEPVQYGNRIRVSGALDDEGDQTLAWTVKMYRTTGEAVTLLSGSHTITGLPAPAPEVAFSPRVEAVPNGTYPVSVKGGDVGIAQVKAPAAADSVVLEIEGGSGGKQTAMFYKRAGATSGSVETYSRYVRMDSAALWQSTPLTLTTYYQKKPDTKTVKTVSIVRVPDKNLQLKMSLPSETVNSNPVETTVNVGETGRSGLEYTSDVGEWKVEVGVKEDSDGSFTSLAGPADMPGGEAKVALGSLPLGRKRMMSKAVLVSQLDGYSRELQSSPFAINILKGTAPEGTISSRTFSGKAPYQCVLGLALDEEDRLVLGVVEWQVSTDEGATWSTLSASDRGWRLTHTFLEGKYQVRAKLANRVSGEIGYTEVVQIQAFKVPDVKILGGTTTFVNGAVNLSVNATYQGQPATGITVEWWDGSGKIATGPDFSATYATAQSIPLTAKARFTDSPADNEDAWGTDRVYLNVRRPKKPSGYIRGESYMEVGKEYTMVASLQSSTYGLDETLYPMKVEWTLPDGTTQEGATITYAPTDADAAKKTVTFQANAWIEGFQDQTQISFKRYVVVGKYVFPTYKLVVDQRIDQAPSSVILKVLETDNVGKAQNPTFDWLLPAGATWDKGYGQTGYVTFAEPGSYDVFCTVKDARGSEAVVNATVVVKDTAPFVVATTIKTSNALMREPLDVFITTAITGGHPNDRIESWAATVDGTPISAPYSSINVKGLLAGDHVIELTGTSKMGKTAEAVVSVPVVANVAPTCELTTEVTGSVRKYARITASCTDSDGQISTYAWLEGATTLATYRTITMPLPDAGKPAKVLHLIVKDDAGGTFEKDVTISSDMGATPPDPGAGGGTGP